MNKLIVITGPTGSGKTDAAIGLAQKLGCHIISADSRQIYAGIPICTAAPTPEQLAAVPHHFIASLPLTAQYSAAQFEADALALLHTLWQENPVQIVCGGSMMYVDALCNGIDLLPTISDAVRANVLSIYERHGLEGIRDLLLTLDPDTYHRTDPANPRRNIHAVEICLQAGVPASTLLTGSKKERPFTIEKYCIMRPREELFERINARVDAMVEAGLEAEARSVFHLRHLNSLNTVGFKEMFAYFDGTVSRERAIEMIKKNTRVYAKKQLTWMKKDADIAPLPS